MSGRNGVFDANREHAAALDQARQDPAWRASVREQARRGVLWAMKETGEYDDYEDGEPDD